MCEFLYAFYGGGIVNLNGRISTCVELPLIPRDDNRLSKCIVKAT